jgi:glycine cleavage system aminomethyltransferase T
MTQEDVWVMDSVRRDVDRDIVDMLGDGDDGVSVIEWWDVLGFDKDMTVKEMQRMGFVGEDGVHLTCRANRCAAASLCIRYRGEDERWRDRDQNDEQRKRRRLV